MNKDLTLTTKLENYIQELDSLVNRMNAAGFPFDDATMVYEEVSKNLKELLAK